jgi:cytochrome c oxidase subunit IV
MAEHTEHKEHHVIPLKIYFAIFGALMLFTLLTVYTAFVDLGGIYNTVVALAIAVTKASLVILFFMHIKYSPRLFGVVVVGSFFWFGIMIVLIMGDYITRHLLVFPGRPPFFPQ